MTVPALPDLDSTDWYAWASAIHDEITVRLAAAQLASDYVPDADFQAALATSFRETRTTDSAVKTDATFASSDVFTFAVTSDMVGRWLRIALEPIWNLAVGGGTGTDVKMQWTGLPSGTTGWWQSTRIGWDQPGDAGAATGLLTGISSVITAALQEGVQGTVTRAVLKPGAVGTITLQWAQNTANASGGLKMLAGSSMGVEVIS